MTTRRIDAEMGNEAADPANGNADIEEALPQEEAEPLSACQPPEKPNLPALAQVLSRRSAASFDPGPAPDGGVKAWIQVFCTHLTILTTFGFFTSFGVYQTYYENTLGIEPSTSESSDCKVAPSSSSSAWNANSNGQEP